MHHVETEIAWSRNAGECVHVGAVAINETAARMHQPHHLSDVLLEQPERVGVGDHDAGNGVVAGDAYRLKVYIAACVGWQFHRSETRHGGRSWVGTMGGVGDENARALYIAALAVIGAHNQKAGEFALRTGRRLQRYAGKATNLGQPLLQLEHKCEVALHGLGVLQRMRLRKSG